MPRGSTKFSSVWLAIVDDNNQRVDEWCRKGRDDYHAYCVFCNSEFKCDNAGVAQILQHAKKDKHKSAFKYAQDNNQAKLVFTNATNSSESSSGPSTSTKSASHASSTGGKLVAVDYSAATCTAEVIWLAKVAVSNFSLRSTDHIGDTFQSMFPDSKVSAGFNLSRTSSYILAKGLTPYLRKEVVDDVNKSNLTFSMHSDETATSQVKKQMDLTLRYWSPTHNEVTVTFYTSVFWTC